MIVCISGQRLASRRWMLLVLVLILWAAMKHRRSDSSQRCIDRPHETCYPFLICPAWTVAEAILHRCGPDRHIFQRLPVVPISGWLWL